MNNISITDKDYLLWVKDLASRYRQSQIKAAVRVNTEQLKYYWLLGRDIVRRKADARWGSKFFKNLSEDLKKELPGATCFSVSNILYIKNFYLLFQDYTPNTPQVVEQLPATETSTTPQVVEQYADVDIFAVPWGHYRYIIDRFMHDKDRALFYVRKTVEYGWRLAGQRNFSTNLVEYFRYHENTEELEAQLNKTEEL